MNGILLINDLVMESKYMITNERVQLMLGEKRMITSSYNSIEDKIQKKGNDIHGIF